MIKLVSGGSGIRELANLDERQMAIVIEKLSYIDTISDIILIDTGAGISNSVLNFVKASNEAIIITTPEPTSLTDSYAIVKTIHVDKGRQPDLKVLVNRAESEAEAAEVFERIRKVSKIYLDVDLENIGYVPYDINILRAVKKQEPVLICFPETEAAKYIDRIGQKLLNIEPPPQETKGIKSFMKRMAGMFLNK